MELDERVLSAARERDALSVDDLLRFVEQHSSESEPGVATETLTEYGRALTDEDLALDARSGVFEGTTPAFTDGTVQHELDERVTDAESWVGNEALYEVGDDRVSNYPSEWHDEIGEATDLTECIAFVRDASAFSEVPGIGTEEGVPEGIVFDVATVVGGFTPDEARARLEERKEQGEIIEDRTTGPSGGLRARDETATSDSDLPPVIDIRDALDEIEATADTDVSGTIDDIRKSLEAVSERDRERQEPLLDDIEDRIVSLRTGLEGDADRRAEGIVNRIQQYRTTDESTPVSFADAKLLDAEGTPVDVAVLNGEIATLDGTLVNGGDSREGVVVLTLYASDGTPLKTIESRTFSLESDEQRAVKLQLHVPENATYYATAAFDAADARAITDGRPAS